MAMTFAERMALRKQQLEAGGSPTTPLVTEAPKDAPTPTANADSPKPATSFGANKSLIEGSTNESIGCSSDISISEPAPTNPPVTPKRFGFPKKEPVQPTVVEAPQPDEAMDELLSASPSNKQGAYVLSSVITMANAAGTVVADSQVSEGELLIAGDIPEDAIRIKQRISLLAQVDDMSIKSEMDELKKLIKAAPQACQFILPEELGECVRALRRMTDNKVAADLSKAKPRKDSKAAQKEAVPKMSLAEISKVEW